MSHLVQTHPKNVFCTSLNTIAGLFCVQFTFILVSNKHSVKNAVLLFLKMQETTISFHSLIFFVPIALLNVPISHFRKLT